MIASGHAGSCLHYAESMTSSFAQCPALAGVCAQATSSRWDPSALPLPLPLYSAVPPAQILERRSADAVALPWQRSSSAQVPCSGESEMRQVELEVSERVARARAIARFDPDVRTRSRCVRQKESRNLLHLIRYRWQRVLAKPVKSRCCMGLLKLEQGGTRGRGQLFVLRDRRAVPVKPVQDLELVL